MNVTPIVLAVLLGQSTPVAEPVALTAPVADTVTSKAPEPVAPPAAAPVAAARPFAPKVTPYGFLNFQFSTLDAPAPRPNVQTFEFRRARIGLRGEVTREIGFNVIFDGADNALKDAFASLRHLPGLEVRLGQFKTTFGYEQQEADTRLLWLYNSYAVQALARGRDSRDVGVSAAGKWNVVGPVTAEAAASVVNGAGPNAKDDLTAKVAWGRAGVAVALAGITARVGASYADGHQVGSLGADLKFGLQTTGLDDTYFYFKTAGVDLTVDSPWVFLAAEWIQSKRHVTRYTAPTASTTTDVTPAGGYVGAYTKSPWNAGLVLRAERAHLQTSAGTALTTGWNERYTVGAYYDVVPVVARVVVNYEVDESPVAIKTGDRFIAFVQVMF